MVEGSNGSEGRAEQNDCDEVVHSLLDVMYSRAPPAVIQRAIHIHPTVAELIPTMLGELKPLE